MVVFVVSAIEKLTFGISFDRLLFEILTFIMEFFALGQGNFNFDFAAGKIGFGGDQGQAFYCDFADQALDFISMEEEFAGA
jgi:hypothetical protein